MGFEIDITDSKGRKHDSIADMISAEVEQVKQDTFSSIEDTIRRQHCSKHGEYAQVTTTGSGDERSFEITGCCDELVQRAEAAASAQFD